MKIGDRIYVRGYVDEIRKDTVIVRNDGGYFGTIPSEVITGELPSAQPEPLTDKEQRIFLAAMRREEKVCEGADRNHVREPYEDSLMRVCHEITRKVKGALWT